ncbi:MAG: phosphatase PAP2 family protein [Pasteurellaceae bacterium]|nr:phosphatase PAP2 family protein [Pasteurellaceae bacterium]
MLKKLSLLTFLMLLVPLTTWAIGWKWTFGGAEYVLFGVDFWLFLLTETGSTPYALITCVLFMLWLMWLTRKRYSWLLVGFICASSVVGTQIIKEGAKAVFKEPRPFVTEMFQGNTEQFYALSKLEQKQAVKTVAVSDNFAVAHQVDELGYSFPSGHTIFAVSWLLVFGGFLFGIATQGGYFAQLFAILWAGLMLISRLRLGMHYPIDLFVSTLIAWAFHLLVFIRVVPYLETWNLFKYRGK